MRKRKCITCGVVPFSLFGYGGVVAAADDDCG